MSESEKAFKSQKSYKGSEMQAFCTGYEMAADKYKAELEQLKNPWISVEDQLPLKSGKIKQVMVLATDGIDVEQCQFDAGTNWAEWNFYNNMEACHIKKWMPLPKLEGQG